MPARLLTIYCASEAVRTRSPEIYLGHSVHEFLRCLDVPITRGERGSLRVYANQLLRLIHCAVSIDENIRDANGRTGLHIRQALFVEEARLWWDEAEAVGQGSSLVLSSVLFQSILERSAPLSSAAIRQLRKSPMDLDVYAWLVHRLFNLTRPNTVTWAQLSGQFGHGYTQPRKFRHFFLDSLKRVLAVYPDANVKPSDVGLLILPSRPHVPRAWECLCADQTGRAATPVESLGAATSVWSTSVTSLPPIRGFSQTLIGRNCFKISSLRSRAGSVLHLCRLHDNPLVSLSFVIALRAGGVTSLPHERHIARTPYVASLIPRRHNTPWSVSLFSFISGHLPISL